MTEKRSYILRDRAKSRDETRQRIVEAAMHLHEEIGPRATTISGIAERAGVQRLTVYRHFADEAAVFRACTAHWLTLNPPPDPAGWAGIRDGEARLRAALESFYSYYRSTRRMWTSAHDDVAYVPALQEPMAEFRAFLGMVAGGLEDAVTHKPARAAAVSATLHHAFEFTTWKSLDARGLDDSTAAALVLSWVKAAGGLFERNGGAS